MRSVGWVALAVSALLAGTISPSIAAQPPRVEGQHCGMLGAQIGPANVWQTTFWGWRDDVFGQREDIFVAPCFPDEAACRAWLYWAQSDWTHNSYQNPPCQRGIR